MNARTKENITPLSIGKLSVRSGGVIAGIFESEGEAAKRSLNSNIEARLLKA